MPDSPPRFRAQPQNVELGDPLKFATPVSYRCGDPKAAIEAENYFLGCRHLLTAGDEIRVACIRDDGTWDKALYEVALCEERAVVVQRIGAWRHGGKLAAPRLKAVHEQLGKWQVEDQHGKVVRRNLSKPEAYALAGLRLDLPKDAPKGPPKDAPQDVPKAARGKGTRKTAHATAHTTARKTTAGKTGEAA